MLETKIKFCCFRSNAIWYTHDTHLIVRRTVACWSICRLRNFEYTNTFTPINVSPHLQPLLINYSNCLHTVLSITFKQIKQTKESILFLLIYSINWYLCVFYKWLNGILWETYSVFTWCFSMTMINSRKENKHRKQRQGN